MRVGSVAARYAEALFELAREQGMLERVDADVDFLGREMAVPGVAAYLFDARVPLEHKRARIDFLRQHVTPLVFDFLRLLLDKRRLEVLRELPAAFHRCVLRERNAAEGVVEAPRPLLGGELAELSVALGARLGKEIHLETRIAPELIAGARVFVDGKLFDQSALGRLRRLRERMQAARLPA